MATEIVVINSNVAFNDNSTVAVYDNVAININLFQGVPY